MKKYKNTPASPSRKKRRQARRPVLTNRDLRFETRYDVPISKVMTKEISSAHFPVGTTLEQAEEILHEHHIKKLLVVEQTSTTLRD